jgi:hypothetical protein
MLHMILYHPFWTFPPGGYLKVRSYLTYSIYKISKLISGESRIKLHVLIVNMFIFIYRYFGSISTGGEGGSLNNPIFAFLITMPHMVEFMSDDARRALSVGNAWSGEERITTSQVQAFGLDGQVRFGALPRKERAGNSN